MRLPEDPGDDRREFAPMVVSSLVAVLVFVSLVLGVVFLLNSTEKQKAVADKEPLPTEEIQVADSEYPDTKDLISGSKLTPDDLDFWDQYPEESSEAEESISEPEESVEEADPSTDGKHTLLTDGDGKEEWVLISPYLPKHNYNFTNLVCQSDFMKYYVDGKQVSFMGTDLSKYQDYVDFGKLKKAGIDFVMLRVGARGYSTGQLVEDDFFMDNIKRASDAGLQIGVYFFSQAVTEEEAKEEARFVLDRIRDYNITYPVTFDMEYIANDTSRIDGLTKAEKTAIAKAFLDQIKEAGYIPMIYGNKEWLIKQIDLSKLTEYDFWLAQKTDIPDYPYEFSMWQYNEVANLEGIAGYASLDVSFIDYSLK